MDIFLLLLLSRADWCLKPETSTIRKACTQISGPMIKRTLKKINKFSDSSGVDLANMPLKYVYLWFFLLLLFNLANLGHAVHGRQSFDSKAALQASLKSSFQDQNMWIFSSKQLQNYFYISKSISFFSVPYSLEVLVTFIVNLKCTVLNS